MLELIDKPENAYLFNIVVVLDGNHILVEFVDLLWVYELENEWKHFNREVDKIQGVPNPLGRAVIEMASALQTYRIHFNVLS